MDIFSWDLFERGFQKFSETLLEKGIKLSKDFQKYRNKHPILDDIIKTGIILIPAPLNEIALHHYKKFTGESKVDAAIEIFEILTKINKGGEKNFQELFSMIKDVDEKGAKQETLMDLLAEFQKESANSDDRVKDIKKDIEIMKNEVLEEISGLKIDKNELVQIKKQNELLKRQNQILMMIVRDRI